MGSLRHHFILLNVVQYMTHSSLFCNIAIECTFLFSRHCIRANKHKSKRSVMFKHYIRLQKMYPGLHTYTHLNKTNNIWKFKYLALGAIVICKHICSKYHKKTYLRFLAVAKTLSSLLIKTALKWIVNVTVLHTLAHGYEKHQTIFKKGVLQYMQ